MTMVVMLGLIFGAHRARYGVLGYGNSFVWVVFGPKPWPEKVLDGSQDLFVWTHYKCVMAYGAA